MSQVARGIQFTNCAPFKSGEPFCRRDVCTALHVDSETARHVITYLLSYGLAERVGELHFRKKKTTDALRRPWRKRSNEAVGARFSGYGEYRLLDGVR